MDRSPALVLELLPTDDDTWLYVGTAATGLLTGSGAASGDLEGAARWSARAQRTDRWETEIEGTITTRQGALVGFSATGFLLEAAGTSQEFVGGMRFKTGDPRFSSYNRLFCRIAGVFDRASGSLRLETVD